MVDPKMTAQVLQRTPLFTNLNQRQLERLAKRFVEREYAAGEKIVTQGRGGEGFFIVASGRAEAVREHADGERTVLNPLEPGDFFGEMALLTEGMRTASVITTEPTTCLILTRWDFLSLLREDADMAVAILQELAERFSRVLSVW
ncbi:MAG: cyclic nucleotide-binding domain-containing protein [Chloroflexi bacterium]|nr:cyclic nucleotide-binding domain-containing protein [Chloroflexota bacterium]OQB02282.1 MAG: Acetyltransferase Pat [Chloroflexi bacterium ADurb.Bin222]HOC21568.1 cyclic nucleotide-binding domain-containing protein [Anaerolineae bacterium]HOS79224.1 cyclic nucleotide-binding domain-containing protein [Anaerolineae bacterium]HQJ10772.1 cyclic nucleotide-binding domain-containing protein [Anaerolineae bacterium]